MVRLEKVERIPVPTFVKEPAPVIFPVIQRAEVEFPALEFVPEASVIVPV
jgi:hypothetical protein